MTQKRIKSIFSICVYYIPNLVSIVSSYLKILKIHKHDFFLISMYLKFNLTLFKLFLIYVSKNFELTKKVTGILNYFHIL